MDTNFCIYFNLQGFRSLNMSKVVLCTIYYTYYSIYMIIQNFITNDKCSRLLVIYGRLRIKRGLPGAYICVCILYYSGCRSEFKSRSKAVGF